MALQEGDPREPRRMGDAVYDALRQRILAGRLPPGARLSVPALAAEFAVSRSPVRDAVIRLVHEGLAQETLNRGAVVAAVDTRELVSLYEAREALEAAAARLATEKSTPELMDNLNAIFAEHEHAVLEGDFPRHVAMDAAFHREVRRAADSPVLERMLDDIQDRVVLAMRSTSITGGMRKALEDHRAILEAVASGDPELAARVAGSHIKRLKELLRDSPA